ncbi:MAG: hypothetical protein NT002_10345 [candidate division Zixibacteria bacterium]|nr:hypothetical protein [candidate division Zixibacteria bacterium]
MKTLVDKLSLPAILLLVLIAAGCDNNPIKAFQPEIMNKTDSFQFQITHAANVTTTLTYTWNNTGTRATINHATALTRGTAAVMLLDANGNEVYSSNLKPSGTETSVVGTAGAWTIKVTFGDFGGTANFRAEKL